jgi:hypothetical protein
VPRQCLQCEVSTAAIKEDAKSTAIDVQACSCMLFCGWCNNSSARYSYRCSPWQSITKAHLASWWLRQCVQCVSCYVPCSVVLLALATCTTPASSHHGIPTSLLCRRYGLTQLVSLGGFTNTRQECAWRGFVLELDATRYPWGCLYELEAETVRRSCRGWAGAGPGCRVWRFGNSADCVSADYLSGSEGKH